MVDGGGDRGSEDGIMTSHFEIILHQLAFCEMSQGLLARDVDSPLTWTFSGNNREQIEPFSH